VAPVNHHFESKISDISINTPDATEEIDPLRLEFNEAKSRMITRFEREYLRRLMATTHGNVTLAARRAGKERRALGKLLKKHGIERSDYIC
jgi:DNA-binding NtrC family response regulator